MYKNCNINNLVMIKKRWSNNGCEWPTPSGALKVGHEACRPPPTPPQKTQATTPEGGTANPPTPARLTSAMDAYLQANSLFKIKGTSINNFWTRIARI